MDIRQFFRTVCPSAGPYLIAIPVQWHDRETGELKKGFRHTAHDTVEAAAQHATALATDSEAPAEVYFALGNVKENRKKGVRLQSNIKQLKAFWLDLDVDPSVPGKYTDQTSAVQALKAFCKTFSFPKPTLVNSGGGIHCYWPLVDDINVDQWNHYARLLKAVVAKHGLRTDPSRTSDCASVLRPAGTFNWKTGSPRPVSVVVSGGLIDNTHMLARIAAAADELNAQPAPAASAPSITIPGANPAASGQSHADNSGARAGAVEDIPSNPKRVVSKCQQLRAQAMEPSKVDEPSWYAMVGCLRFAVKGEKAVHAMSKGYPGYDPAETDRKLEQHKAGGFGPSTCVAFENAHPAGCEGCPYKGKITTPLQLGRETPEAPAPMALFQSSGGQQLSVPLPDPPKPYKRAVRSDGTCYITATIVYPDESEEDIVVYQNDLYPIGLHYDERESKFFVTLKRYLPKDGWDEYEVALGKFFDKRNLAIMLGDMGIMPSLDRIEHLVNYMIGYIQELQQSAKAAMVYAKMGWRDEDKFVMPDKVITSLGHETVEPSRNTVNALRWKEPKGDIEEWKSVARLYERPGMEALQFGFGVGFAAPLFRFTNFDGMIVSMVGEKGCGKSSAAKLANSVWGHQKVGWMDIKGDTLRAFYNKLGVLQNLPATFDEVTNLPADELSDLCYSVSKGEGRQRLKQDGSAKEDFGSWQTIMLTTSNASLHSRLTMAKADASAESARVFEFYVPSNTLQKAVADTAFEKLNHNFGLAGPMFMDFVISNVSAVRDRVLYWMRIVDKKASVSSGERFWSAAPACVLTAFEITNGINLTNVDIGRLLDFVVSVIGKMRTTVTAAVQSGFNLLSEYLNVSLAHTLTIGNEPQLGKIPMIKQEPRGELRIRFEEWHGLLFVDRADVRRYCAQQAVDPNKLREELMAAGVLLKDQRIKLGKHTSFGHGQTWCWVLDANHPAMGAAHADLTSSSHTVAAQAIQQAQGAEQ